MGRARPGCVDGAIFRAARDAAGRTHRPGGVLSAVWVCHNPPTTAPAHSPVRRPLLLHRCLGPRRHRPAALGALHSRPRCQALWTLVRHSRDVGRRHCGRQAGSRATPPAGRTRRANTRVEASRRRRVAAAVRVTSQSDVTGRRAGRRLVGAAGTPRPDPGCADDPESGQSKAGRQPAAAARRRGPLRQRTVRPRAPLTQWPGHR